jgi:uncharacterized membrane protein
VSWLALMLGGRRGMSYYNLRPHRILALRASVAAAKKTSRIMEYLHWIPKG